MSRLRFGKSTRTGELAGLGRAHLQGFDRYEAAFIARTTRTTTVWFTKPPRLASDLRICHTAAETRESPKFRDLNLAPHLA